MIPSSSDLHYFLEVANTLNLSRAAECLGISQPSLTLSMHRIETAVGTAILVRHKRGVSLTRSGKQLLAHARQLLQQWELIKSKTLASVEEVQGSITIGCHTSVALYSLPRFLGALLEKYPNLDIRLQHDLSRKITEQVINLKLDIGIVINPVKHPDLVIQRLDSDKITLWTSTPKYKIQNLESGAAVIVCDTDLVQTQSILKALKKQKLSYSRLIHTNSLEVIAELTSSGCGIGILPGTIAASRNLLSVHKAPFYKDELCLLYRGENRYVRAIQTICNAIKIVFKNN